MDPQEGLAGLQGHAAESATSHQTPAAQATQAALIAPTERNITGALDFMHDTLYDGKPFRTLNIIVESNRETLAIEIDTRLPAGRVIRTLEQLGEIYGLPQAIRLDNGPELRSAVMTEWCEDKAERFYRAL